MSVTSVSQLPARVVVCGVSEDAYAAIRAALPDHGIQYSQRHGSLEMDSLLHDVSWEAYEALLEALPEHRLRHAYDRGTLEIMSPKQDHEWAKRLIGRFIEAMALELDIPIKSVGSTTRRGKRSRRGLEPDESYYVQSERLVRGKRDYDPKQDPPPDLAVEVDMTSSSVSRMGIYAKLRVPEIWRFDGQAMQFCGLDDAGRYVDINRSRAFPFLEPADVLRFLEESEVTDENSLVRSFVAHAKVRNKRGKR